MCTVVCYLGALIFGSWISGKEAIAFDVSFAAILLVDSYFKYFVNQIFMMLIKALTIYSTDD